MKLSTIFILVPALFSIATAQPISRVGNYSMLATPEGERKVVIEMPFGKSTVVSVTGDTADLRNSGDLFIDIICTEYPASKDLSVLNRNRLETFFNMFPFINSEQVKRVEIFRQTDGALKEKAVTMFHGLVIRFRPAQTEETVVHDLKKIDEILSFFDAGVPDTTAAPALTVVPLPEKKPADTMMTVIKEAPIKPIKASRLSNNLFFRRKLNRPFSLYAGEQRKLCLESGYTPSCIVVLSPREALRKGFISRRDYRGSRDGAERVAGLKINDSLTFITCPSGHGPALIAEETAPGDSASRRMIYRYHNTLPDSTVFKAFGRNRWKQMDIVTDVTGSMYPYTTQLLIWLKLQSLDSLTSQYTFFNDGDNTPDRQKKIGKTGGIYSRDCKNFDEVATLMRTCMTNGGGGDAPENDLEALIETEKQHPQNDFHVLIADNWANIKDIKLARQINKPVRVVLCGVFDGLVNTQYLDLARITGGSVHLIDQDIMKLAAMHEGEILEIGRRKFKIVDGMFREVVSATGI